MIKKFVLIIIACFIFFPFLFFYWWQKQIQPIDPSKKETQIFIVPQGWGVKKISQRLKEEQLIRDPLVFQLMVFKEGMDRSLQAGDFRLSPSMNLFEIAQDLTHGTLDIWITIPEGLRNEEIAIIIDKSFAKHNIQFDSQEFLKQAADSRIFLFPDTYLISKSASASEIVKILNGNFEKKYSLLKVNSVLNRRQIVILASLVEREARYDKDRPIIAGILLKRLKKGWPLQVDATVQYAKATIDNQSLKINDSIKWWPVISGKDLKKVKSSYNSYENIGLPPAPICNPGIASLQAAADPSSSAYWYYISDKSGHIHYAKNLQEQEENIIRYLTN